MTSFTPPFLCIEAAGLPSLANTAYYLGGVGSARSVATLHYIENDLIDRVNKDLITLFTVR